MGMKFARVTIKDLEKYARKERPVSYAKADAMWRLKGWITGIGKLTDEGQDLLAEYHRLGDKADLSARSMHYLESYSRGVIPQPESKNEREDRNRICRLGLVMNDAVTSDGKRVIALFERAAKNRVLGAIEVDEEEVAE